MPLLVDILDRNTGGKRVGFFRFCKRSHMTEKAQGVLPAMKQSDGQPFRELACKIALECIYFSKIQCLLQKNTEFSLF
jgi:hypothetical protein